MNYHEATDIARKNQGAVLTRDAFGSFTVRLTNGSVICSSQTTVGHGGEIFREREDHLNELSRIYSDFAFREDQLRHEFTDLTETITKLKASVSATKLDAHQLSLQLETLRAENATLQSKLAKVSTAEWERIKESDKLERTVDYVHRKAERRTFKCSCLGEVENCVRCFGAGQYTVDGFGNRV